MMGQLQGSEKRRFTMRVVQSVLHEHIHDRQTADAMGRRIADTILADWDTISRDFGDGRCDEVEIVERVTHEMLRQLAA